MWLSLSVESEKNIRITIHETKSISELFTQRFVRQKTTFVMAALKKIHANL